MRSKKIKFRFWITLVFSIAALGLLLASYVFPFLGFFLVILSPVWILVWIIALIFTYWDDSPLKIIALTTFIMIGMSMLNFRAVFARHFFFDERELALHFLEMGLMSEEAFDAKYPVSSVKIHEGEWVASFMVYGFLDNSSYYVYSPHPLELEDYSDLFGISPGSIQGMTDNWVNVHVY